MKTQQTSTNLKGTAFTILSFALLLNANTLFGQVKIGAHPTTIEDNANLQVESTDGTQLLVRKGDGFVGINTKDPKDLLHVRSDAADRGVFVSHTDGNSNVLLAADGGVRIRRNGLNKPLAQHIGAYLDLVGQTNRGWRMAEYADFLGIAHQNETQLNQFPFYIHNNGVVSIGSSSKQVASAALAVNGFVSADGYATRGGIEGGYTGNMFNIAWNGTIASLWIDNRRLGEITTTSDYRLKKNVVPALNNALERVRKLRPVSFDYKDVKGEIFKSDGITHEGFIAHELQEIVPSAVNGKKDGLTADGKLQPQTLNPFPVISLLTKAIQEQQQQIEQLKMDNMRLKGALSKVDDISAKLAQVEEKLQVAAVNARQVSEGK